MSLRSQAVRPETWWARRAWLWWQVPDLSSLQTGPTPVTTYMWLDARERGATPSATVYTPLAEMTPLLA